MTFSIVGYDPETEEIGVAVHSKVFSVGTLVAFVRAGVGAVATQSLVNVALGPLGLDLMAEGRSPEQALEHFRTIDQGIEFRQLGFYSLKDGSYSFTGESCIGWAGSRTGEFYACQGNILTGPEVVESMGDAFEQTKGTLADRLLAAIIAGAERGGDARGKQSAAIIIDQKDQGRAGYGDRKIDLRVEDAEYPIKELKRLLSIAQLNIRMQEILIAFTESKDQAIADLTRLIGDQTYRWLDEAWMTLGRLHFAQRDHEQAKIAVQQSLAINPGMLAILRVLPKLGFGFDEAFVSQFGE